MFLVQEKKPTANTPIIKCSERIIMTLWMKHKTTIFGTASKYISRTKYSSIVKLDFCKCYTRCNIYDNKNNFCYALLKKSITISTRRYLGETYTFLSKIKRAVLLGRCLNFTEYVFKNGE